MNEASDKKQPGFFRKWLTARGPKDDVGDATAFLLIGVTAATTGLGFLMTGFAYLGVIATGLTVPVALIGGAGLAAMAAGSLSAAASGRIGKIRKLPVIAAGVLAGLVFAGAASIFTLNADAARAPRHPVPAPSSEMFESASLAPDFNKAGIRLELASSAPLAQQVKTQIALKA